MPVKRKDCNPEAKTYKANPDLYDCNEATHRWIKKADQRKTPYREPKPKPTAGKVAVGKKRALSAKQMWMHSLKGQKLYTSLAEYNDAWNNMTKDEKQHFTSQVAARKEVLASREKKPMNAYMLWYQSARPEIMTRHTKDPKGAAKQGGEMWKRMSDAEKAPFRDAYAVAKAIWERSHPPKKVAVVAVTGGGYAKRYKKEY